MQRRIIRRSILTLILALTIVITGVPALTSRAQEAPDDASRFAEIMAERDSLPRLDAPSAGDLVQQEGDPLLSARTTEADIVNFVASATFYDPSDLALFDIFDRGFAFHGGNQFAVDSLGFWYYRHAADGHIASGNTDSYFDATENSAVTIDLVVEGDRAMFGFGGQFAGAFDIAPGPGSFVAIDTGFSPEFRLPGRIVSYTDFAVWALPDTDQAQSTTPGIEPTTDTGAPSPPDAASTSIEISPEASEQFAALLAAQQSVTPLAGPFNALLKESVDTPVGLSWAGVNVADFHASAVVTVPDDPESLLPWSAGFAFGPGSEGEIQVTISSFGDWEATAGVTERLGSGELARLLQKPGQTNTLDLLVQEQTAWLGLNGDLVAIIPLPADRAAGDVALAAGLYFDDLAGLYVDELTSGRITPFQDFTVRALTPGSLAPAESSGPTAADEERFLTLLSETDVVTPAAGPFSGRLVETTPGNIATAVAGVAFFDFAATATVVNPADPALGPWDSGFQFRIDGETASRVMVDSLGDVYAAQGEQAPVLVTRAATYDAGPNNTNALQLFVEGERALFGINGVLVAAFDVPASTAASDVHLGVAFFTEDFVQGRVTDYRDFRIWEIG